MKVRISSFFFFKFFKYFQKADRWNRGYQSCGYRVPTIKWEHAVKPQAYSQSKQWQPSKPSQRRKTRRSFPPKGNSLDVSPGKFHTLPTSSYKKGGRTRQYSVPSGTALKYTLRNYSSINISHLVTVLSSGIMWHICFSVTRIHLPQLSPFKDKQPAQACLVCYKTEIFD